MNCLDRTAQNTTQVTLTPQTQFIFSPSGSATSLKQKNETLARIGLDVSYFTFPHSITGEEYASLLRSPIARGGAVTGQGLKTDIIPWLDALDPLAESMQSVNTVVNSSGRLVGYNTDAIGFKTALTNAIAQSGIAIKTAVVYGNGGVSSVAVKVMQSLGVEVTLAGRNPERVARKMKELNLSPMEFPVDLVVNATPISGEPLESAVGLHELLADAKMVFDHNMPEKEGNRNFLKEFCDCENRYFISGLEMYVPQLIEQWMIFLRDLTREDNSAWVTEESIAVLVEESLR